MDLGALKRYSGVAADSSALVINRFSTSFGLASRLLERSAQADICNIYALVRVADEVVDGAADEAGLSPQQVLQQLDDLECETERALELGFSTNLVVHTFAQTARATGIGTDLTGPFFASMRTDLGVTSHSAESLDEYIYGSAEVVGLMCLKVFLRMPGAAVGQEEVLEEAARRLGAAFQKVNFLRDLAADSQELGREYFPGTQARFGEAEKAAIVADIYADLAAAELGIPLLPPSAARAVELAHNLFHALNERLEKVPAAELRVRRIRVPTPQKARITLRVLATHRGPRSRGSDRTRVS